MVELLIGFGGELPLPFRIQQFNNSTIQQFARVQHRAT
jgi:hypothetical protein